MSDEQSTRRVPKGIVALGNAVDGFCFIGPFENERAAEDWAHGHRAYFAATDAYTVAPLLEADGFEEQVRAAYAKPSWSQRRE